MTAPFQPPPDGAYIIGGDNDYTSNGISVSMSNYGQSANEDAIHAMFSLPSFNVGNAISVLGQALARLPMAALDLFRPLIPDWIEDGIETVASIVGKIISALDPTKIPMRLHEFTQWLGSTFNHVWVELKQIIDVLGGMIVTPINAAIAAVQDWWQSVGHGFQQAGNALQNFLDSLWGGLARALGLGRSAADVANAAKNIAQQSDTALQVGEWNNAILGIRNNKTLMEGIDETEESTFLISDLFQGTSEPPSIPCTAANVPIAFWRATEDAKKGFVSWFGKGIAGITELHVDIYKLDPVAQQMVLLHSSPDLFDSLTSGWKYNVYYIPVEDRIDVAHGEVYGFAIRVIGSGTHTIGGKSAPWLPEHPTVVPAKPAAVRTGAGTVDYDDIVYSGNIPWFGFGIAEGDIPPPYFADRTTTFLEPGTWTFGIPTWANIVDVVICGAGGGGRGGNVFDLRAGEGGDAGEWATETLVRGVDFPVDATEISGYVGVGGNGGPGNTLGQNGEASRRTAISGGKSELLAAGGPRGNTQGIAGTYDGDSRGNITHNGVTYNGGEARGGNHGRPGGSPGAGGAGGAGGTFGVGWAGGKGGNGAAFCVARRQ